MPTLYLDRSSGSPIIRRKGTSFFCCCDNGCCMYRAEDFGVYYDAAGLPDAVTLSGFGSLSKSGSQYGNTTNGVILEDGKWAVYKGGVRTTQSCLISGNVADQFAAQYHISWDLEFFGSGSTVVTRESLCYWGGGSTDTYDEVYLTYVNFGYEPGNERPTFVIWAVFNEEIFYFAEKLGPTASKSPAGDYTTSNNGLSDPTENSASVSEL